MPTGEPPQAIVSSPPFEDSMNSVTHGIDWSKSTNKSLVRTDGPQPQAVGSQGGRPERYGISKGQLGRESGNTFWSAARAILFQCHQVLAPGGVAIWVVKDFVRNKERVDFTGQWRSLCESYGFETIEVIRAWLVEDRGAQFALDGELVEKRVEKKSFFRRLYEIKARAAEFWKSASRDDKARHLWQAHHDLWEDYRRRSELPNKEPSYPTKSRILSAAQMMAYVEAGKPDVEIDTQIDYEVVLVTRKV